jgi:hypothetical protein
MKTFRWSLLLVVIISSFVLTTCDDNLEVSPFKRLELVNQHSEAVYAYVMRSDITFVIDVASYIPIEEVTVSRIESGGSYLLETSDIHEYDVNSDLVLFAYVDGTITDEQGTREVAAYAFSQIITAQSIRTNAGKIFIKEPEIQNEPVSKAN